MFTYEATEFNMLGFSLVLIASFTRYLGGSQAKNKVVVSL